MQPATDGDSQGEAFVHFPNLPDQRGKNLSTTGETRRQSARGLFAVSHLKQFLRLDGPTDAASLAPPAQSVAVRTAKPLSTRLLRNSAYLRSIIC